MSYFSTELAVRVALFKPCKKKSASVKKISRPNPIPISFEKFFAPRSL